MNNSAMKLLIRSNFLLLALLLLNNCAGLYGSLSVNGAQALLTGQVEKSVVSSAIDVGVHKKSGKTPGQHLYAMIQTEGNKDVLEKHFPDGEINRHQIYKKGYDTVIGFGERTP